MQPGGDGGLAAEAVGRAVGGDQGVLHGVGRLLAVAESAQRDGPQPVAVAADDLRERVGVAVDMTGEQFAVVEALAVVESPAVVDALAVVGVLVTAGAVPGAGAAVRGALRARWTARRVLARHQPLPLLRRVRGRSGVRGLN